MNKTIYIGNLTRDVELTSSGETQIAKFTIAVQRRFKKDEADFIRCVAFNKTGVNIAKYFSKGKKIVIVGHTQTGSYDNKEGVRVYTNDCIVDEFEFIESSSQQQAPEVKSEVVPSVDITEDDLPF